MDRPGTIGGSSGRLIDLGRLVHRTVGGESPRYGTATKTVRSPDHQGSAVSTTGKPQSLSIR